MRPPDPLPKTSARSISYSRASFLTDGEARPAPSSTSRCPFDSSACGCSSSRSSGCSGAAPSASLMVPIISPTFRVSPSPLEMDSRTPSCSASTSKLILSVSSSTSASPTFTASPSCLRHFPTVASATDSPSSGTCISTGMSHQPSQNLASLLISVTPSRSTTLGPSNGTLDLAQAILPEGRENELPVLPLVETRRSLRRHGPCRLADVPDR
jgi:hypothetical protein